MGTSEKAAKGLSLQDAYGQYCDSIIKKENKKTVDFLYPKIFDFIPKKTMIDALNNAQKDNAREIQITDFAISKTHDVFLIDGTKYAGFTSSSKVTIIFKEEKKDDDLDDDEADDESGDNVSAAAFTFEIFKEKYGDRNVKFFEDSNTIVAKVSNHMLAISDKTTHDEWRFLEIKESMLDLYTKFIPEKVIDSFKKLFEKAASKRDATSKTKTKKQKPIEVDDPHIKRLYLAGWEVHLNGDQQCEYFLTTQVTTKETVKNIGLGLELVFENEKLVKAYKYEDGKKQDQPLEDDEVGLPYVALEPNKILQLAESEEGLHQLGGEVPTNFRLPQCNSVVPFQYLGYINNKDEYFSWLPNTLHLAFPIYLNIGHVFLDYSDPMQPAIINKAAVEEADTSFEEELNRESEIVFEDVKIEFEEDVDFSYAGHAGIPNWIQNPDIPTCPKSGKRMRFVCQLHSGPPTKRTNFTVDDDYSKTYFEEMNFWIDGDLYVFFEPTSKVACYFIQNT